MASKRFRFRWAELQVEAICDPEYVQCADDVEEALGRLPETLEATYSETIRKFRLERHGTTSRVTIENALKLLYCAEDSIYVKTLLEAVSVGQDGRIIEINKLELLRMSRSLIVIDEESGVFRFAHLSVREYLEKQEAFSGDAAHAVVAELCLGYLLHTASLVDKDQQPQVMANSKYIKGPRKEFGSRFQYYALIYWPRHCMKAKLYRQSDQLQKLLLQFLGIGSDSSIYRYWNTHLWRDLSGPFSIELWRELRSCQTYPPNPLFVICTYGFYELLPQVFDIEGKPVAEIIAIRNYYNEAPDEVAASHGRLETLEIILTEGSDFYTQNLDRWIGKACKSAARHSPNVKVMELLISMASIKHVDEDLVSRAACNTSCGAAMLDTILAKAPNFVNLEASLQIAASECKLPDNMQFLLSRLQNRTLAEDTFVAACQNFEYATDILRLFVAYFDHFDLTEEFMIFILQGRYAILRNRWKELLDVLFSNGRTCPITSKILEVATLHQPHVLEFFLSRYDGKSIDERIIRRAVQNLQHSVEVLEMLKSRFGLTLVTESLLENAMLNRWSPVKLLEYLFSFPNRLERPQELLYLAASNKMDESVALLLQRYPTMEINDDIFLAAAGSCRGTTLDLLLSRPRAVVVSEPVLERVARFGQVEDMETLLQHAEGIAITERMLIVAAQNTLQGVDMLKMLLAKPDAAQISEEVVSSVLSIFQGGVYVDSSVLTFLFEKTNIVPTSDHLLTVARGGRQAHLTCLLDMCNQDLTVFVDSVLQSIHKVRLREFTPSVVSMLLPYLKEEYITQDTLRDAAAKFDLDVVETLLIRSRSIDYSELLTAAAGNDSYGGDLVRYFLSFGDVIISKEAFLVAAQRRRNNFRYVGCSLVLTPLWLLFQHHQPQEWSQEIALSAATNLEDGREAMKLIMRKLHNVSVNQELLEASATNPSLLEYLMCQPLDGIIDVAKIAQRAGEGGLRGMRTLSILIQSGLDVQITEDILKSSLNTKDPYDAHYYIGFNERPHMRTMLGPILDQESAEITEDVVKEGLKNEEWGLQMIQVLMAHPKNRVPMTQSILEVAVQNRKRSCRLVRYIFDGYSQNVQITESVVALARGNDGCGQDILQVLLHHVTTEGPSELVAQTITAICKDPHGLRNALFKVAHRGQEAAFKALMNTGANLTESYGDIGTVLHVASWSGKLEIVKILAPYARTLDVPGGPFGSPILAALMEGHVDVAKYLVGAGVSIETVDQKQRTILHRLVQSKASHHTATLLELGASIEATDIQGFTALHYAIIQRSMPEAKALLNAGAPTDIKDTFGWTPLHWAARIGYKEMAELLVGAKADVRALDSRGMTPLGVAVVFGKDKLRTILWTGKETDLLDGKHGIYAEDTKCGACGFVSR